MKKTPIIFVTSHAAKAKQVSTSLKYPVIHKKLDVDEVQSLDPVEVVTKKVRAAYQLVKQPVMVEDVAVTFKALGRLPGTYFKAFLGELKVDGLCRLLDGYDTRNAVVEVNYAYFDGVTLKIFRASVDGTITSKPRGKVTFGSDAIFIPEGQSKTWSEMTEKELVDTSITTVALAQLRRFLESRTL